MQFNLYTAHGRAHAYAASAEGAELVRLIESYEEFLCEQMAEKLDMPLHSVFEDTQYVLDQLQDTNYDAQLERYKNKLSTIKQQQSFNHILRIQRKREQELLNSLIHAQMMLTNIKEIFKML